VARLPTVKRDQVPEQFREAFDELTASSGGVITSVIHISGLLSSSAFSPVCRSLRFFSSPDFH
jgi:hypothetical protein